MPKNTAPNTATQDDDLPQTAVKPTAKELMLSKLAEYEAANAPEKPNTPEIKPTSEEETWKKRYGDLRRHSQTEENTLKNRLKDYETQIQQLTIAATQPMPKTREEFEEWKHKYPDVVPFIEMIADEKATMSKKEITEELNTVKEKLSNAEREKAYAILTRLVPDWEAYVTSQEFQDWKLRQPTTIINMLNTSDDPHDLARLIGFCKLEHSKPIEIPASRNKKLDALDANISGTGITPNAYSGKWKYTQSQIAKMTTAEYTKNEEDIIAARNDGLILDDMSKRNTVFER